MLRRLKRAWRAFWDQPPAVIVDIAIPHEIAVRLRSKRVPVTKVNSAESWHRGYLLGSGDTVRLEMFDGKPPIELTLHM